MPPDTAASRPVPPVPDPTNHQRRGGSARSGRPVGRLAEPAELLAAASEGDRLALARLLSLLETGGPAGRAVAAIAYRSAHETRTVGVTGAPGAGKSSLVSRLISLERASGTELGVLAVDPTSPFSGGAILGDRVRMQEHALDDGVYIRSMASRGHLGGLAVAVPEALRVLATVGFDLVVVETVGVGQVEVEVASATDTTVVVVTPRWGDAVQASKAGLLETADVFVINKADLPGARETRRDLEQMLDLAGQRAWRAPVVDTTASTGEGIEELRDAIDRHHAHLAEHGLLDERRRLRLAREFQEVVTARIEQEVDRLRAEDRFAALAESVMRHELDPYEAADQLLTHFDARRGGEVG